MGIEIITTSKGIGTASGTLQVDGENPLSLTFSVISDKRIPLFFRLMHAQECDLGGCSLPTREVLGDLRGVNIAFRDLDGRELVGDPKDKSFRELKGAVIESVKGGVRNFEDLTFPELCFK